MKLSNSFKGALRRFTYFIASGTHYHLEGIKYLDLFGEEPSAIEQAFAIFSNVIEFDEKGKVLNSQYAEKRATDYIRSYCNPEFEIQPPFEDWETELYSET